MSGGNHGYAETSSNLFVCFLSAELQQQHVCEQDRVLADEEDPEPPQVKEEEEEAETFMLVPACEAEPNREQHLPHRHLGETKLVEPKRSSFIRTARLTQVKCLDGCSDQQEENVMMSAVSDIWEVFRSWLRTSRESVVFNRLYGAAVNVPELPRW